MPKVKGPINGELFAKFDGKAKIDGTTKKAKKTGNEKNLVLISVQGNEYCNHDYLNAALKSASSEFSQTTFLIVDDPQCYNIAAKESLDHSLVIDAGNKLNDARALGDTWWQQNETSILKCLPESVRHLLDGKYCPDVNSKIKVFNELAQKHNLKINFIRWNEWINQSSLSDSNVFENYRQKFDTETVLKQGRAKTAEKFSSRKTKKNNSSAPQISSVNHTHDVFLTYSQQFLTDESIGVMIGGKEKGYHYVSYAGDQIDVLKSAHDVFVGEKSNLLGWLNINFERRVPQVGLANSIPSNTTPTTITQAISDKTHDEPPPNLEHLKNRNLCIHIVPFKEKENQSSRFKKTVSLFKTKSLNDNATQTKNIILIEDSTKRFELSIKDKENLFEPKFYRTTVKETFRNWCNSHDEIISAQTCECLSFYQIKEKYSTKYDGVLSIINGAIEKYPEFKKAFENSALAYLNEIKLSANGEIIDETKAKEYALEAVKEKCAILITIAMIKSLECINTPETEHEAFNACKKLFSRHYNFWCIDNHFNFVSESASNLNDFTSTEKHLNKLDFAQDVDQIEEIGSALNGFNYLATDYDDSRNTLDSTVSDSFDSSIDEESSLNSSLDSYSSDSCEKSTSSRLSSSNRSSSSNSPTDDDELICDSDFAKIEEPIDETKNQNESQSNTSPRLSRGNHVKNLRIRNFNNVTTSIAQASFGLFSPSNNLQQQNTPTDTINAERDKKVTSYSITPIPSPRLNPKFKKDGINSTVVNSSTTWKPEKNELPPSSTIQTETTICDPNAMQKQLGFNTNT